MACAIGKWKVEQEKDAANLAVNNSVRLPFRTQPKPDYRSRVREKSIMMDLLAHNVGGGTSLENQRKFLNYRVTIADKLRFV